MTQPPFDPYGQPVQPVHYPQAGQPPQQQYPHQYPPQYPHQYPPGGPQFPGAMRGVDQITTARVRPGAIVAAVVCWLLAALSWPVGTVVRTLAEDGSLAGFGPVMTLFATGCVGVAGVWGAVALLGGSYHARLALCGVAMVLGVLGIAAAIIASRDDAEVLSWVVILLRLVLPAVAAVFSFLPGTRYYFAGNLG